MQSSHFGFHERDIIINFNICINAFKTATLVSFCIDIFELLTVVVVVVVVVVATAAVQLLLFCGFGLLVIFLFICKYVQFCASMTDNACNRGIDEFIAIL